MKHDIKVPEPGESITEVFIGEWQKKSGDVVKKDDLLVELETEKTSFEIRAEHDGKLEILYPDPESKVKPGEVIATIDDSVTAEGAETKKEQREAESGSEKEDKAGKAEGKTEKSAKVEGEAKQSEPDEAGEEADEQKEASQDEGEEPEEEKPEEKDEAKTKKKTDKKTEKTLEKSDSSEKSEVPSAAAKKLKEERGIDVSDFFEESGEDSEGAPDQGTEESASKGEAQKPKVLEYEVDESRGEQRKRASRIRRTIAANLVAAQQNAAILTTFNEADMSEVMEFRKKHNPAFQEKHGVKIGIVNFFARAAIRALKEFPEVNSTFTGADIIYRDFVDLGIAVSTEQGLVVPVIRDCHQLSLVDFEKALGGLQEKAVNKKLSIEEMSGGTFTISNGGVFGSLLSTPILNMPQSAILGLHSIQKRPVVIDDEIEIRPMMYLALSYDHRIIDGKEAVQFLVAIKEGIEDLYHIIHEKDLP